MMIEKGWDLDKEISETMGKTQDYKEETERAQKDIEGQEKRHK